MEEVKLLGTWPSPFTYRVMWALKLKNIPFEYIEQNLSNKSPSLLELNPVHKKVPVLVHNGKPICESLIILEYIDQTWPQNQLLPDDPYEKAIARFWANFADKDQVSPIWKVLVGVGEDQEKGKKDTLEFLRTIENHAFVGDKKFFGGENIGYVDLAMGKFTVWIEALEEVAEVKLVDPELFPRLHAWIQEFKRAPTINENLPGQDQLLSSFKKKKEIILGLLPSKRDIFLLFPFVLEANRLYPVQEKSQLLLEANPVHKKVPILFHRGRAIAESTVILEYIEETWPEKPLMPADPYQRALARFWIKFGDHDVIPIVSSCLIATGEEQEKATKEARESLIVLEEKCLGNNKFFGGDTVGLIDLAFGWLAYCLEPTQIAAGIGTKLMDPQSLPRLSAWAHAFKEVSVIKRNLPDYDKIVSYLIRLREKKLVKP